MFDANLRHVKNGHHIIIEIGYIGKQAPPKIKTLRAGRYLAQMVDRRNHDNCLIEVTTNSGMVRLCEEDVGAVWVTYEGHQNETNPKKPIIPHNVLLNRIPANAKVQTGHGRHTQVELVTCACARYCKTSGDSLIPNLYSFQQLNDLGWRTTISSQYLNPNSGQPVAYLCPECVASI